MRQHEVERYRGMLRTQLQQLLGHGSEAIHQLVDEQPDEPDPNDRATVEEERAWSLRLADRDRKLIPKLQQALARIEAGTFGQCTRCGRPIATARLRARPMTELCIDCKAETELRER